MMLHQYKDALEDAKKAVALDSSYVKVCMFYFFFSNSVLHVHGMAILRIIFLTRLKFIILCMCV
jgi:hypothetical protein